MLRPVNLVVIHCSATPNERTLFRGLAGMPNFRTPAEEIDAWHAERGFSRDPAWRARHNPGLSAIGYHYVIARNGALFTGRHPGETGAHVTGWNKSSLGVCLVGTDQYTPEQWRQAADTVSSLCAAHKIPTAPPLFTKAPQRLGVARPGVCGHRDIPGVAKTCPGFAVAAWLGGGLAPLTDHLA